MRRRSRVFRSLCLALCVAAAGVTGSCNKGQVVGVLTLGISLFFQGDSGGFAPIDPAFAASITDTPEPPITLEPGEETSRYVFLGADLVSDLQVSGTLAGTGDAQLVITVEVRRADSEDFVPVPGASVTIDPANGDVVSVDLPLDGLGELFPGDVVRVTLSATGTTGDVTFSDDQTPRNIIATVGNLSDRTVELVLAGDSQNQGVPRMGQNAAVDPANYQSMALALGSTEISYAFAAIDRHAFEVGTGGVTPTALTYIYEGAVCYSVQARATQGTSSFRLSVITQDSNDGQILRMAQSSFTEPLAVSDTPTRFDGVFEDLPAFFQVTTTPTTQVIPPPITLVVEVLGPNPIEFDFDAVDPTQRSMVRLPGPSALVEMPQGPRLDITHPPLSFERQDATCAAAAALASTSAQSQTGPQTGPAPLTLSITSGPVSEAAGAGAINAIVSRTGSVADPLVVELRSEDVSELTVPASVTIAAGATDATFAIDLVDDTDLDGDQTASIRALAPGFRGVFASVTVTDNDLEFGITPGQQTEGQSATATLRRGGQTGALSAQVTATLPGEVSVPATVTIPDGASDVTFQIDVTDDAAPEARKVVTIDVASAGFLPMSADLTLIDNDLSLTVPVSPIPEGQSAQAIVARGGDQGDLTVTLALSNADATVPATVTIPAGLTQIGFAIDAVQDTAIDGDVTVNLTASAPGFGAVTKPIVTQDDDLGLTLNPLTVTEAGGRSTGTVRRGQTTSDLTIDLTVSTPGAVTMPAQVTILAGDASADFVITASDDTIAQGRRTVDVSASAAGFPAVTETLAITDDDLEVRVSGADLKEKGGQARVTVKRGDTRGALFVTVAALPAGEVTAPTSVTLADGEAETTFTVEAIDDTQLDGSQSVTLTLDASGFATVQRRVTVLDDDLQLTIDPTDVGEDAGTAAATATIERGDTSGSLDLTLTSDRPGDVSAPAGATILDGETKVQVALDAIDNELLDGSRLVRVRAVDPAGHFEAAVGLLRVTDAESLAASQTTLSVSEDATATLTVSRSNVQDRAALTFNVRVSDASVLTAPSTVTIPAGSTEASVTLSPVDNQIAEGDRTARVTFTAAGMSDAETFVTVVDDETPGLLLSLSQNTVDENAGTGAIQARVRRNTPGTSALTVTIAASTSGRVSTPSTVTIPAGEREVTFDVAPLDNVLLDGSRSVTLTISASGFSSDSSTIRLEDDEPGRLALSSTITATRNQGVLADATDTVDLTVSLTDGAGNVFGGQTVILSATSGAQLEVTQGQTGRAGVLSSKLRSARAGAIEVSALVRGPWGQVALQNKLTVGFDSPWLTARTEAVPGLPIIGLAGPIGTQPSRPASVSIGDALGGDGFGDVIVGNPGTRDVLGFSGDGSGALTSSIRPQVGQSAGEVLVKLDQGQSRPTIFIADPLGGQVHRFRDAGVPGNPDFSSVGALTMKEPARIDAELLDAQTGLDVVSAAATPQGGMTYFSSGSQIAETMTFPGIDVTALGSSEFGSVDANGTAVVIRRDTSSPRLPVFAIVDRLPINGQPVSLASGTIVGFDKTREIVSVNAGDGTLALLSRDSGALKEIARIKVGTDPQAVAVADLNGDLFRDLVCVNRGSKDISILLGDGQGKFVELLPRIKVGGGARDVAIGDINGDNRPDIVTANESDDSISVILSR